MHGYFTSFDKFFGLAIKKLPTWLRPVMLAVTFIGEPLIIIAGAATAVSAGLFRRQPRLVLAEVLGLLAFGGNTILKHLVHRTRPDTLYVQHMKIKSYSFPSGHAFGSIVVYGLLAFLACTRLPQPWSYIIASLLILLITLIGVSRVYLEAHFPSDVVVGWLLGGACLLLIIKLVIP